MSRITVRPRATALSPIEALQRKAAEDPRVIDLAGGLPSPRQFPRAKLGAAFAHVLNQPSCGALQYGWPEGSSGLRHVIAARLQSRGADIADDDVIVTNGAQEAIAIAVQIVCRPGSRIGVEPTTYQAALELFRTRELEPTASGGRVAAHYVMPALSNPSACQASDAERKRLLASHLPIIEDDAYAELRFDGPPPAPLVTQARTRVWHVGTFSKTLCPGLRVGWLVPPRSRAREALRLKRDTDLQSNSLAQSIVERYLCNEDFDARLERLRASYARRARTLFRAARRHLPEWRYKFPQGGFVLWLETPSTVDEMALLRAALQAGVSFDPGSLFRADRASEPTAVRLCFSYADESQLEKGVARLASAWKKIGGRRSRRKVTGSPSPNRVGAAREDNTLSIILR